MHPCRCSRPPVRWRAAAQGSQHGCLGGAEMQFLAAGACEAEPLGIGIAAKTVPLIAREAYVGGESRRLVDRLFGGSAASLVAHLAESEALTNDDLDEIAALLRELRA